MSDPTDEQPPTNRFELVITAEAEVVKAAPAPDEEEVE
jgi:hypothetical protein